MPSNHLVLCRPLLLLRGGRIQSKIWIDVSKKASPSPPPTPWSTGQALTRAHVLSPRTLAFLLCRLRPHALQRPCLCPHYAQMIGSLCEPRATVNHQESAEPLPHFHVRPKQSPLGPPYKRPCLGRLDHTGQWGRTSLSPSNQGLEEQGREQPGQGRPKGSDLEVSRPHGDTLRARGML